MPKTREITKKQKDFADRYLETGNWTKSALEVYDTDDYATAWNIASDNLKKPQIKAYLDDKGDIAGSIIEQIALDEENDKRVRLEASKFMYDHAHWKAKQRTEITGWLIISEESLYDEE